MAPRSPAVRAIKPPAPRECDLSMFRYMPLHIERLRRSRSWSMARRRPELGFYMLNLWMFAWHEVPAGSLDADDALLCDRAGCSPEKWKAVRDDLMHGWHLATDGRLYHDGLVRVVREAWAQRTGVTEKKATHAETMRRSRERARLKREAAALAEQAPLAPPPPPPEAPPPITAGSRPVTGMSRVTLAASTATADGEEGANPNPLEDNAKVALCLSREDHVTVTCAHVTSMKKKEKKDLDSERKAARESAALSVPESDVAGRRLGLRLSDPPHQWVACYGGRTEKDENGRSLPVAGTRDNTVFLIAAAAEVCEAAGFDPAFRGDWHTLVSWLDDGHLLDEVILSAIRDLRDRRGTAYRVPKSLAYFSDPIAEFATHPDPGERRRARARRTG